MAEANEKMTLAERLELNRQERKRLSRMKFLSEKLRTGTIEIREVRELDKLMKDELIQIVQRDSNTERWSLSQRSFLLGWAIIRLQITLWDRTIAKEAGQEAKQEPYTGW